MTELLQSSLFVPSLGLMVICGILGFAAWRSQGAVRRKDEALRQISADNSRLSNQLQQARRMEAVGILAGSIVHNLNNLLAVILGHARMAGHELKEDDPVQEELNRIRTAGNMASELVKEISDFYRQAEQASKPTDLVPVVRNTLKLIRDILPSTVEIRTELEMCGPVLATATGLQQILMNLCSNALHAMVQNQGTITVTLREQRVSSPQRAVPQELAAGTYVVLSVEDDGRGMDSETLTRVFESYYSKTRRESKMGIGLSTVYRILEAHDGVTIVDSTVGEGTRFDLYFPLIAWSVSHEIEEIPAGGSASKAAAGPLPELSLVEPLTDPSEPAAEKRSQATVLLVDDEEMVAHVMARGLKRLGYRVITHVDSRTALADFSQTPEIFDVVVTDQIMPHMSGVRLTRKIHQVRPDVPVVLFTGFRDSFNEMQAKEAGVTDFILKPSSHRDLANLIDRIMLRSMEGRG